MTGVQTCALPICTTRTVQVGQTLKVMVRKTDAGGLPLSLSVGNLPANARFDASYGEFIFTPTLAQAGNVFQVAMLGMNANSQMQARLDVIVLADNQVPQVRLVSPASNQPLMLGKTTKIMWTTDAPQAVVKYELRLSLDGGASYPTVLAQLPKSATSFDWTVPDSLATQRRAALRLMVLAVDAQNRASLDFTAADLQLAGQLAVVSSAHYLPTLTPGGLCSAFGTKLAAPIAQPETTTSLYQRNGTTVEVMDSLGRIHRTPLFFAASVSDGSYDQVNFYLPEEAASGAAVVTITAATGEISQGTITIQPFAPAIFTQQQNGKGEAAIVATIDGVTFDYGFAKQDPKRDVYVSLFGTGWRFANQEQGGKSLEFTSEVAAPRNTVTVEINRQPVEVLYAGPQPEYLGLDQLNLKLPRDLKPGIYPMVIKIGDQMSNEVLLRVQ